MSTRSVSAEGYVSIEGTERFTEAYGEAAYMYIYGVLAEGRVDRHHSIRILHKEKHDRLNCTYVATWQPVKDVIVLFEFYNGNLRGDGIESFVRMVPWLP